MDITHLHLHTRDRRASEAFYRDRFGLATADHTASITFMKGERDVLLALMEDPAPEPAPAGFHFGMKLPTPAAVRAKRDELAAAGVPITTALRDEPSIASFRCVDPNGYAIEIYWLSEGATS